MLTHFKIGHYSDQKAGTGCTIIVPPDNAIAAASVRGSSPGTREIALLAPEKKISHIHALVLTGGSAFGLGCAHGVMEALAEQGRGYQTDYGVVPIVPAAVIFDKNVGDAQAYPCSENARSAFQQATFNNVATGNVGAGTGASVGKWMGMEAAMKGGIGIGQLQHGPIKVTVLSVVNAVGDILDKSGQILAGAVSREGHFYGSGHPWQRWEKARVGLAENTVLCAVMSNARLNKQQAYFIAERAHYGIARRIDPSHTSYDGDVAFVMALPEEDCPIDFLAAMVVHAVEESILNAVTSTTALFGLKSVRDLGIK
mgnify:CR=1 FL=1